MIWRKSTSHNKSGCVFSCERWALEVTCDGQYHHWRLSFETKPGEYASSGEWSQLSELPEPSAEEINNFCSLADAYREALDGRR